MWPQGVSWLNNETGVQHARAGCARDLAHAAADAVAEHLRQRSGGPVQRAAEGAVGGGMEASDSGPSMYPRSRSGD